MDVLAEMDGELLAEGELEADGDGEGLMEVPGGAICTPRSSVLLR